MLASVHTNINIGPPELIQNRCTAANTYDIISIGIACEYVLCIVALTKWGALAMLVQGDPKSAKSWYPLLKAGDAALQDLLDDWENIVPAESTNGDVSSFCMLVHHCLPSCAHYY
jgi:hypothetical protein